MLKFLENPQLQPITKQKAKLSKLRMVLMLINYFIGYAYLYPWLYSRFSILIYGKAIFTVWEYFLVFITTLVLSLWIMFPLLKESWANFKSDWSKTLISCVLGLVIILVFSALLGALANFLSQQTSSENQQSVDTLLKNVPLLATFSAVIFAPIVEELIFRGIFYRCLRPRLDATSAMMLSGLLFGLAHISQALLQGNFAELAYVIVYGFLGILFAGMYEYRQNIYGSMIMHALYNGIAILLSL